ncbi:MAG: histidine phosphatase family protein [Lewinellaceae bacterium]|nr:histidine phosphatase family protein [Lewinellaceae bacterium]
MKKQIYIVRHGETELNRLQLVQGSGVDAKLNDTGRQQAEAFFNHYQHIPFEVVITSGLQRTHQTMEPFINQGLPWEQTTDINEISWGVHEGKTTDLVMRQEYQTMISDWQAGRYDSSLEGGESANDLALRLQRFVDHLRQRPESTILVCSHGRAMRCLMALLQEDPLSEMEKFHHHNTGLYEVVYQPDIFKLIRQNDIRHLESAQLV